MECEERHDYELAIVWDLAGHEMHDVEQGRIVVVLPLNLFLPVERGSLFVLEHLSSQIIISI